MDIEKRDRDRRDVLGQVYDLAGGDTTEGVFFKKDVTGYDLDTLEMHVSYLTERGLLTRLAMGIVSITAEGVEEHERNMRPAKRSYGWVNNPWLVGIGVTVIGGLIVWALVAFVL